MKPKYKTIDFKNVSKIIFKEFGEIYSPALCKRVWNKKQQNNKLLVYLKTIHCEKYTKVDFKKLSIAISVYFDKIYTPTQLMQIYDGKYKSYDVLSQIKKELGQNG